MPRDIERMSNAYLDALAIETDRVNELPPAERLALAVTEAVTWCRSRLREHEAVDCDELIRMVLAKCPGANRVAVSRAIDAEMRRRWRRR